MKEAIRSALALKSMTQTELANRIGISAHAMSDKINGKSEFGISELRKIVDVLGVDPAIFFRHDAH